MLDRAAFLLVFAEFKSATNTEIDAQLARAARYIGEAYGDSANDAHGFLTAHFMALSPFGQNARLVSKNGTTLYWASYEELRAAATCGIRVPGASLLGDT